MRSSTVVSEPWPWCGPTCVTDSTVTASGASGPRRSYAATTAACTGGGNAGDAAQRPGLHRARQVLPHGAHRRLRIQVAVVEAVGQQHHVRGEAVAPHVTALPHLAGPFLGQGGGHRAAPDRAAGVVHAVGADQDDRLPRSPPASAGSVRASAAARRSRSSVHGPVTVPGRGRSPIQRRAALRSLRPGRRTSRMRAGRLGRGLLQAREHGRIDARSRRRRRPATDRDVPAAASGAPAAPSRRAGLRARRAAVGTPERGRRLAHPTTAMPASTSRRARSRPRSPAVASPWASSAFTGATSGPRSARSSPARLRTTASVARLVERGREMIAEPEHGLGGDRIGVPQLPQRTDRGRPLGAARAACRARATWSPSARCSAASSAVRGPIPRSSRRCPGRRSRRPERATAVPPGRRPTVRRAWVSSCSARAYRVQECTPMVRWVLTPPRAAAACRNPRGRYRQSPGRSTASISGGSGARSLHRAPPVGPGLVAQRRLQHRCVDLPALLAGDLQHEDVVHVVVVAEPLVLRRGDVRVGLDGMAELGRQLLAERDDRRPDPVQALQHHGRAVGEQPDQLVVADLIGDAGAHPAGCGEASGPAGCCRSWPPAGTGSADRARRPARRSSRRPAGRRTSRAGRRPPTAGPGVPQ